MTTTFFADSTTVGDTTIIDVQVSEPMDTERRDPVRSLRLAAALRAAGYKCDDPEYAETTEDVAIDWDDEYLVYDEWWVVPVTLPYTADHPAFDDAYDRLATLVGAG